VEPKPDPFATPLQKRIDAALLVAAAIIFIIFANAFNHGSSAQPALAHTTPQLSSSAAVGQRAANAATK
jgi:hypothetical protein